MFLTAGASKARRFSKHQVFHNYDSMNLVIVNIAMNCIHFLILVKRNCKYEVTIFPFTYPSLAPTQHFHPSHALPTQLFPPRPLEYPPPPFTDLEFPDHPVVQLRRNHLHKK